jgi:UDP-galactopyranose mutase
MYDYVIVGSGIFGSVFAQQAHEHGKRVLVLEKRDHVGGNCHSYEYEDTGITVHAYGTHIFHTNDERIWAYARRFSAFNRYQHRVLTTYRGRVFAMPINLGTINAFYGTDLRPHEIDAFLSSKREAIAQPRNLEEKAISLIGRDLYEAFVKGYTQKQWACDPKELPASIITRLPVRSSYHDAYFDDLYQGIPVDGYTPMFQRMLDGIHVECGVDFIEDREYWHGQCHKVVYSGPIDRYFDYEYGRLSWRSVRFELERLPVSDHQGTSVMNYADLTVPYTRVHEPKHLHLERKWRDDATVIIREYPAKDDDAPYYPINAETDRQLLARYRAEQARELHTIFGGRLAQYKYYDMHQVIAAALKAARDELLDDSRDHASADASLMT